MNVHIYVCVFCNTEAVCQRKDNVPTLKSVGWLLISKREFCNSLPQLNIDQSDYTTSDVITKTKHGDPLEVRTT